MLSPLERLVACELQASPRGSVASMAAKIGEPQHVVRAVFDRLMRSGALTVTAIVDPSAFGRPLVIGFRITVTGGRDGTLKSLLTHPEFHWLAVVDDATTLLATANFADVHELQRFTEEVIRQTPGVRETSLQAYLEFEPVPYYFDADFPPVRVPRPSIDRVRSAKLDEFDIRLLKQFQQDARISYSTAGERVGLSLSATRQRVLTLVDSGTLRFHVLPNPFVIGFHAAVMVSIKTTGPIAQIRGALSRLPGATFLSETTGEYGFILEFFAESRESLEETVKIIIQTPGILDIRTDLYREIVRDTGTWSP